MINTNDIAKQFLATGSGRVVTLRAFDTVGGVLMANVFDAAMPNPARIPGLQYYWLNADTLTPVQG